MFDIIERLFVITEIHSICFSGLANGGKIESASNSSNSTLSLPRRQNSSDVITVDKKGGKNNQRPQSNTSNSSDQQQQQQQQQLTKRHNEINRQSQKCTSNDATKLHSDESDDDEDRKFRHKLLPEGDDFKIVFISSDSSKESELNSSLEACPEPESLLKKEATEEKNEEDDNMEWSAGGHRVKTDFAATSR